MSRRDRDPRGRGPGTFRRRANLPVDGRWMPFLADLAPWEGKEVEVRLELRCARSAEPLPGAVRWSVPVLSPPRGPAETNLLLITIDTLRADHLTAYGYARPTSPNIDRLARRGLRFENAETVQSATWPALTSLHTSLYPSAHGVVWNGHRMPEGLTTLAEALHAQHFSTSAFITNMTRGRHPGFSRLFLSRDGGQAEADRSAVEQALRQIELERDRRFFMWVHLLSPHADYAPPPPNDAAFTRPGASTRPWRDRRARWPPPAQGGAALRGRGPRGGPLRRGDRLRRRPRGPADRRPRGEGARARHPRDPDRGPRRGPPRAPRVLLPLAFDLRLVDAHPPHPGPAGNARRGDGHRSSGQPRRRGPHRPGPAGARRPAALPGGEPAARPQAAGARRSGRSCSGRRTARSLRCAARSGASSTTPKGSARPRREGPIPSPRPSSTTSVPIPGSSRTGRRSGPTSSGPSPGRSSPGRAGPCAGADRPGPGSRALEEIRALGYLAN